MAEPLISSSDHLINQLWYFGDPAATQKRYSEVPSFLFPLKTTLTQHDQLACSPQEFFWSCGYLPSTIANTSAEEERRRVCDFPAPPAMSASCLCGTQESKQPHLLHLHVVDVPQLPNDHFALLQRWWLPHVGREHCHQEGVGRSSRDFHISCPALTRWKRDGGRHPVTNICVSVTTQLKCDQGTVISVKYRWATYGLRDWLTLFSSSPNTGANQLPYSFISFSFLPISLGFKNIFSLFI